MLTRTALGGQAETTLRWIRWADADYLGARLLLLQGLLVQGAALANTALEKYLKAVCWHFRDGDSSRTCGGHSLCQSHGPYSDEPIAQ